MDKKGNIFDVMQLLIKAGLWFYWTQNSWTLLLFMFSKLSNVWLSKSFHMKYNFEIEAIKPCKLLKKLQCDQILVEQTF